jgi:hypothetical protein
MSDDNPLGKYAKELRSGGRWVYNKKKEPAVERAGFFSRNRELIKQICIGIILVVLLAGVAWMIYMKATGQEMPDTREPLFGQVEEAYVEEQRDALWNISAELASRERVLLAVIDRFFDVQSSFKGRRKLCISFNDKPTRCTTEGIDKDEFLSTLKH